MRIYLDNLIYALQEAGGISVYWKEITERMLATQHLISFLESPSSSVNIFRRELSIAPCQIIKDLPLPTRALRHLDPIYLSTDTNSVFHSSYYRIINRKGLYNIVTVHDFIHEYHRSGLPRIAHSFQKKRAILHASGLICVSEHTKSDLLAFFPSIPEERIKVIYHGYGKEFYRLPEVTSGPAYLKGVRRKVVVYIGDRAAYKNFHQAVEAVASLPEFHLVIVGGNILSTKEKAILDTKVADRYTHVKGISNTEVNLLYNVAHCLLYPSSFEGFGIPVLEAMAAGCPVVAVNTSSIPEVAGKAAILTAKAEPELLAMAIHKLTDPDLRTKLIQEGFTQAQKFSWDKCFSETLAFYEHITTLPINYSSK